MSSSMSPIRAVLFGVALGLDPQQLLLVVPLVQRLGLVEALVALQPDEAGPGHLGDGFRQLGLAGTGGALDENRLLKTVGEMHNTGDAVVGEVRNVVQLLPNFSDGLEAVISHRQIVIKNLTDRSSFQAAPVMSTS